MYEGVSVSKRDIKAKRWFRKKLKRNYRAAWDWAKTTTGKIKAIAYPVSVTNEEQLKSVTQMRMFGDGRWQYRDGISGLHGSKRVWDEWRDC